MFIEFCDMFFNANMIIKVLKEELPEDYDCRFFIDLYVGDDNYQEHFNTKKSRDARFDKILKQLNGKS